MRVYRERLGVPASWWLLTLLSVLIIGSTLWAGLNLIFAALTYVVLGGGCAAALLIWGSVTIEVSDGKLRAGSQCLPLEQAGQVTALDAEQTRSLRGPRADPMAHLLIRGYLPKAVYIEVSGQPVDQPYWLIATRKPAELAAAIEQARPQAGPSAPWDDAAGDHAAVPGAPGPAGGATCGKDSNAW